MKGNVSGLLRSRHDFGLHRRPKPNHPYPVPIRGHRSTTRLVRTRWVAGNQLLRASVPRCSSASSQNLAGDIAANQHNGNLNTSKHWKDLPFTDTPQFGISGLFHEQR